MILDQKIKLKKEHLKTESNYPGHTEQCGEFIGHPSEPCKRCGFSYHSHTG